MLTTLRIKNLALVADLTIGEQQRLEIIKALIRGARILILDEFTSAVDASTERLIRSALVELMRGRTTFVEMNKLQHYNTPLKVFIGYASDDLDAAVWLKGYGEIIRDADIFRDIATHRRS